MLRDNLWLAPAGTRYIMNESPIHNTAKFIHVEHAMSKTKLISTNHNPNLPSWQVPNLIDHFCNDGGDNIELILVYSEIYVND